MASTGGADFYGILGVQKGANDAELKRAYRKLAMRWHPDKNKGDDSAKDKFQEISRAYDVLTDAEKRAIYDKHGLEGVEGGGGGGGGEGGRFAQATPTSFEWLQLVIAQPLKAQSTSLLSVPEHATRSIQITPVPCP